MSGGEAPTVRPVRWWHRLHTWTSWELRTREVRSGIGGVYADEWQERRCIRCGVIERLHKF